AAVRLLTSVGRWRDDDAAVAGAAAAAVTTAAAVTAVTATTGRWGWWFLARPAADEQGAGAARAGAAGRLGRGHRIGRTLRLGLPRGVDVDVEAGPVDLGRGLIHGLALDIRDADLHADHQLLWRRGPVLAGQTGHSVTQYGVGGALRGSAGLAAVG